MLKSEELIGKNPCLCLCFDPLLLTCYSLHIQRVRHLERCVYVILSYHRFYLMFGAKTPLRLNVGY
jgi:hypothetical protein